MAQTKRGEIVTSDELQRLEEEICHLEYEYHVLNSLIENSNDAIQISDRNLVTLRVNRAYEILTGIQREELVGRSVKDLEGTLISESCGAIVAKTRKPHTILQSFYRTGRTAHVSCNPVFDVNGEIEFFICNDRDLDEISKLQSQIHEFKALNDRYLSEIETIRAQIPNKGEMIIEDKKMLTVLMLANRVARVDTTVLILGETGVGKDEIARYIHRCSNRANERFVSINCGAIAESLFESELFGHESFAYTGAGNKMKMGLFEVSNHGTLFLDEVGELSLNMQTKLLHVLQSQSFIRVGGNKPIQVDLRIIAATNCDLAKMVAEKKFREDLYYRLNVVPITIPPLRDRRNDIIPLAQHFIAYYNCKYNFTKKLSPSAGTALLDYHWEGNVRELKNTIEQAVIMTDGDMIHAESLPVRVAGQHSMFLPSEEGTHINKILGQIELRYLNASYEKFQNVRDAAKALGMTPTTFLRHKAQLNKQNTSVSGD